MTVYLTMFFIAEIFAVVSNYLSKKINILNITINRKSISLNSLISNIFLWLSMLPFLYVAASRYEVGTDYSVYEKLQIPMLLKGVDYKLQFEYLYQYLIRLGVSLGNTQWVFILTHLVLLIFLWLCLKNFSTDLRMSIFIFMFGAFYNTSLNIMRQFIAIAIFLYAIKFIIDRNLIKYIIMIAIGFLFHKTAIIFLPLYWLSDIKIDERFSVGIVVLGAVFAEPIRFLIRKISSVTGLYADYFNGQFDVDNRQWDFIIFNFVILFIIILIRKYLENQNSGEIYKITILTKENIVTFDRFMFNLQLLATLIAVLSSVIPNSTRIIFMFSAGQIIYLPYLLGRIKDRGLHFTIVLMVIVMYIVMFIRLIIIKNIGETLPYYFFQW